MLKNLKSYTDFILNETFVNLFKNEFTPYVDEVWNIMELSYAKVSGGFLGANSKLELIKKSAMWKLVKRDGKIVAAALYKDKNGRKRFAVGSDGSKQGKQDAIKILKDDAKLSRSWVEASGKSEELMKSFGATPIPAKYASELTGKEIESIDPDGYHYERIISGLLKRKIMYGTYDKNNKLIKI